MTNNNNLIIIHISDLHIGRDDHIFTNDLPPDGFKGSASGTISVAEAIRSDLSPSSDLWSSLDITADELPLLPMVAAITGDLTHTATKDEFDVAHAFVRSLYGYTIDGKQVISEQNTFIVPGNHDLVFAEEDVGRRWYPYCAFRKKYDSIHVEPENCSDLSRIIDRSDRFGLIIAEINSAAYVKKGERDAHRGQVDLQTIARLSTDMNNINIDKRTNCLKIALIHHHPVLIPQLADPKNSYDAVVYGPELIRFFQKYGFHLVLHGHKHYPHVFSFDPVCAWIGSSHRPLLIVAGGSAGSKSLPTGQGATNTYNVLQCKWNPKTQRVRIRIATRGLFRFDSDNQYLLPRDWRWKTLRVDERLLVNVESWIAPTYEYDKSLPAEAVRSFDPSDAQLERKRISIYEELRGNMPSVEVVPSFRAGQDYEARLKLIRHTNHKLENTPVTVTWSAGPKFPVATVTESADGTFPTVFHYYGPMLVQVRMAFNNGPDGIGYVYAHS